MENCGSAKKVGTGQPLRGLSEPVCAALTLSHRAGTKLDFVAVPEPVHGDVGSNSRRDFKLLAVVAKISSQLQNGTDRKKCTSRK